MIMSYTYGIIQFPSCRFQSWKFTYMKVVFRSEESREVKSLRSSGRNHKDFFLTDGEKALSIFVCLLVLTNRCMESTGFVFW